MKVHEWQSLLITLLYYICGSHCAAGKRQLHCLKETSLLAPIYHVSPTEMHSLCDNIFLPCENIHNSGLSIHLGYFIMDAACVLLSWQKTLVTVTVVEETVLLLLKKEKVTARCRKTERKKLGARFPVSLWNQYGWACVVTSLFLDTVRTNKKQGDCRLVEYRWTLGDVENHSSPANKAWRNNKAEDAWRD